MKIQHFFLCSNTQHLSSRAVNSTFTSDEKEKRTQDGRRPLHLSNVYRGKDKNLTVPAGKSKKKKKNGSLLACCTRMAKYRARARALVYKIEIARTLDFQTQ